MRKNLIKAFSINALPNGGFTFNRPLLKEYVKVHLN